jgi:glyoxylase-like metal-dependent hydrolase (beta-lactamase superfamily II)
MGGRRLVIWGSVVGVLVTLPLVAQEATDPRPGEARLVAGSVYEIVLLNGAINMLASVGEDGVLLVDTGYAATADDAAQVLDRLHRGTVRVIVNTHGDPDHVGGNSTLGPDALVISHPDARRQAGTYFALPVIDDPGRRGSEPTRACRSPTGVARSGPVSVVSGPRRSVAQ